MCMDIILVNIKAREQLSKHLNVGVCNHYIIQTYEHEVIQASKHVIVKAHRHGSI